MRKSLLTILLITLSSSAAAALWKCTDAGGAVHYLPEAVTDGSKTCIALVEDKSIQAEPAQDEKAEIASPRSRVQTDAEFARDFKESEECYLQAMNDPVLRLLDGKIRMLSNQQVTPAMLALNRKATTKEHKALATFIGHSERCTQKVKFSLPVEFKDNPYLVKLTQLRDGKITFAEFAKYDRDSDIERQRLLDRMEAEKREAAEQERRRQEELKRVISLSCIVDFKTQLGQTVNGIEWQYQINEAGQTIVSNRGPAAPTEIRIGPTEISFKQAELSVSISRGTGRISLIGGGHFGVGNCQTITQRKF